MAGEGAFAGRSDVRGGGDEDDVSLPALTARGLVRGVRPTDRPRILETSPRALASSFSLGM